MRKSNELIDDFYRMHKEFDFLQSLNFYRDTDEDIYSKCHLDVVLSNREAIEQKMAIHFSEVVDFKSANLGSLCGLLISIIDVSADQLEGIKYRVKEDEYELFSFCCKTFEFKLL